MPGRDVREELDVLVNELGMSKLEAYSTLGLDPNGDPLVSDSIVVEETTDEHESSETVLKNMFPDMPIYVIQKVISESDNDVEKASEILLNWQVVNGEADNSYTSKETKQQRQARKSHRRIQKAVSAEEKDIKIIAATLKVPMEEARNLYWTHGNSVSEVLLVKAPYQEFARPDIRKVIGEEVHQTTVDCDPRVDFYSQMPRKELVKLIDETHRRILARKGKINSSTSQWDRYRATDVSQELMMLNNDMRQMQLALHKNDKIHSSGILQGKSVVDLHGCTLDQTKPIVTAALKIFQNNSKELLEIITGIGRHSASGESVLKVWVRQFLRQQRNFKFEDRDGVFLVRKKYIL